MPTASTSAQPSSSSTGDNLVMQLPPRDGTLGALMDRTVEELVEGATMEGASTPTTASEIMGYDTFFKVKPTLFSYLFIYLLL